MFLRCLVASAKETRRRKHWKISVEAIELYLEPVEDDQIFAPNAEMIEMAV